jgi:hypothetical protein
MLWHAEKAEVKLGQPILGEEFPVPASWTLGVDRGSVQTTRLCQLLEFVGLSVYHSHDFLRPLWVVEWMLNPWYKNVLRMACHYH